MDHIYSHQLQQYAKIKKVILDIPNFTRKIESLAPCSQVNFYSKTPVGAIRSGKYEREQCFHINSLKIMAIQLR